MNDPEDARDNDIVDKSEGEAGKENEDEDTQNPPTNTIETYEKDAIPPKDNAKKVIEKEKVEVKIEVDTEGKITEARDTREIVLKVNRLLMIENLSKAQSTCLYVPHL